MKGEGTTDYTNKIISEDKLFPGITKELADRILTTADEYNHFMLYYRCAIMEVETKLKVLNLQFALQHEYNPIETVKTRLKSVRTKNAG